MLLDLADALLHRAALRLAGIGAVDVDMDQRLARQAADQGVAAAIAGTCGRYR